MPRRSNRRHFKRYDVDNVRGTLQYSMELVVLNMSLTGLAIETAFSMRIGKTYVLKMRGGDDSISVPAEVKWCKMVGNRRKDGDLVPVFHVGLDFTSVLSDMAKDLLRFMEGHIVIELERRIFGRFRLHDAPIELDLKHTFLVKRLSFSGMLVETEMALLPPRDAVIDVEVTDEKLTLECGARVAYIHRHEKSDEFCDLGLEFLDLDAESQRRLDAFIRRVLE